MCPPSRLAPQDANQQPRTAEHCRSWPITVPTMFQPRWRGTLLLCQRSGRSRRAVCLYRLTSEAMKGQGRVQTRSAPSSPQYPFILDSVMGKVCPQVAGWGKKPNKQTKNRGLLNKPVCKARMAPVASFCDTILDFLSFSLISELLMWGYLLHFKDGKTEP